MRGKFITFEGIDGAGKSTHLEWLAGYLAQRNLPVTVTREPGGTEFGEALRRILLDRAQHLHAETEALLMFAARREHLARVIVPALDSGKWVLCDRFTDATFAYQAAGSGISWEKIEALERWVQEGLQPDLTVFFDVSPESGRARSGRVRDPDRFEQEHGDFYRRVREGYLRRAGEHPARITVIDANGTIPEIQKKLEVVISPLCIT
jgi:dTMP kinase